MIAPLQRQIVTGITPHFFYGWVIVGLAGLTLFSSGPGQSHTFSVFIDPIAKDLGISNASIAAAYGTATLIAALLLPYMGRLFDRFGPRRMLLALVVMVGIACFFFGAAANLIWLGIGFGILRFLGQGSMMLGSANIVSQWFTAKRGTAMGLMAVGFALSMGFHPLLCGFLIDQVGWRTAWHILGLMTWVLMLPALYVLAIDKPEMTGLLPDGQAPAKDTTGSAKLDGLTQAQALRAPAFYLLSAVWFMIAGLITVMQLFQVKILSDRGFEPGTAASFFLITAVTMVIIMPLIGRTFDRIKTRYLLALALGVIAAALLSLTLVTSLWMALIYAVIFGCAVGFMMTIFGFAWPRYFGRAHIGSIQGTGQMIGIIGASVAPFPVGYAIDQTGNPAALIYVFAALALGLAAIVILFLRTPEGVDVAAHLE